MDRVRWGILSTASIGVERVIPAMQQGKQCKVAAIGSRTLEKAQQIADRWGIPKAYGSYDEVLSDPGIEAVYIPLPNHLHVPWSAKAAEAGKHALCEKPMALDAAEVEGLIEIKDRTGVQIGEAFTVRSHPQWLGVRDMVSDGRIGRLRAMQAFFAATDLDPDSIVNKTEVGGGGMSALGCYAVTAFRFLFSAEPTRVVALMERDPTFKTDRLTTAIFEFPQGQASFLCSSQLVACQRMQIFGTEGRIEIETPFDAPIDRPYRVFVDDGSAFAGGPVDAEASDVVNQYTIECDLFSEAIRSGTRPVVPLEDAMRNMRAIDALFRSAQSGGWKPV